MNRTNIFKSIGFLIILTLLLVGFSRLFQPFFERERNFYEKKAFNEQPENSVDILLLGSSVVYHGITPMEMYEQYGLSVWDLGSSSQPVSASYYLLKDAYEKQSETLDTVIFDVFELKRYTNDPMRRLITDGISDPAIRYEAYNDYLGDPEEALSYTVPLISYHSRWSELGEEDFKKYDSLRPYLRGYYLDTSRLMFEESDYTDLEIPGYHPEVSEEDADFKKESLYYLKKIIEFCNEHDLELILIKTPMTPESWDDKWHNGMKEIAGYYGLKYLDFSYEPLFSELDVNFATDFRDTDHMNYYGARKLTAWLGRYLSEECGEPDVRNVPGYEHLDLELAEYRHRVENLMDIKAEKDPAEYLKKAIGQGDYAVFITIQDDAAEMLTDSQRESFASMGLTKLSKLGVFDTYIAVIDPMTGVLYEALEKDPGAAPKEEGETDPVDLAETVEREDFLDELDDNEQGEAEISLTMHYEGNLKGGESYALKSGGRNHGNYSSCVIDGSECSPDMCGLNIVLYDNVLQETVDSAVFDTHDASERIGADLEAELEAALQNGADKDSLEDDLLKLYLYNERCRQGLSGDKAEIAATKSE